MFCTACGTKNSPDSHFCKQCGKNIERVANPVNETDYVRAMPEEEQVSALLENAYLHRSRGDLTGAINLTEEAIRLQPSNATAHALLAQIALQKGDRARAIQEYERVVAISPNNVAERIKLEELRESKTPHVVRGGQPTETPASSSFNPIVVVFACAILLAVGAMMGDYLKRQQGKESHNPALNTTATQTTQPLAGTNQVAQQPLNSAQNPANPGAGQLPGVNNSTTTPNNTMGTTTVGQPQPQVISAPPFYPPVVINPPSNTGAGGGTGFVSRTNRGSFGTMPPMQVGGGRVEPLPSNTPGVREHLETTPRATEPNYVVKIDVGKQGAGANTNTVSNPSPAPTNQTAVPSETRTAVEAAKNHLLKNDYKSAIRAFQSALKSPGTQEGYIHQQIGYCYQKLGDKASGRTHYEQAISSYEAQSRQGIQKELAEDGIRACKQGIKLCD